MEHLLRAPHGEDGDDHVAALDRGLLQDLGELVEGVLPVAVVAVPVGRLEQEEVRPLGRIGGQRVAVVGLAARVLLRTERPPPERWLLLLLLLLAATVVVRV